MILGLHSQTVLAQAKKEFVVYMRNTGQYTLWDGTSIRTMGFATKLSENPPIPGHAIIVNEGDSVYITAWNISQGAPHTIHLHGLDVDQENDGVPHLSFEIGHMESGTYRFLATHAGTYLYHCHVASPIHVQFGMYGKLIVRAADDTMKAWTGGPEFNREFSWLTSEIDTNWHSDDMANHDHEPGEHPPIAIPPYKPQYFLVNGKAQHQLSDSLIAINAKANETIYLRIANMGFHFNRIIFPSKLNPLITDSDGRPLPAMIATDTLNLFSGERYGVLLKADEEFSDLIRIEYINMNNYVIEGVEMVPVVIDGFSNVEKIDRANLNFPLIYPNPAKNLVNIQFPGNSSYNIQLFDIQGRQYLIQESTHFNSQINTENLQNGLYVIVITFKEKSYKQILQIAH